MLLKPNHILFPFGIVLRCRWQLLSSEVGILLLLESYFFALWFINIAEQRTSTALLNLCRPHLIDIEGLTGALVFIMHAIGSAINWLGLILMYIQLGCVSLIQILVLFILEFLHPLLNIKCAWSWYCALFHLVNVVAILQVGLRAHRILDLILQIRLLVIPANVSFGHVFAGHKSIILSALVQEPRTADILALYPIHFWCFWNLKLLLND